MGPQPKLQTGAAVRIYAEPTTAEKVLLFLDETLGERIRYRDPDPT